MKLFLATTMLAIAAGKEVSNMHTIISSKSHAILFILRLFHLFPSVNRPQPLRGSSLRGAEKDCILEEVSLLRIPGQVLSDPLHPGEDMD
eukprot:15352658-Ditylum_brightwellii.AAC.1